MEFEQIIKRLEFLDKQQRETKDTLAALKERLASYESSVDVVSKQIKTLSKQVAEVQPVANRIDQFETLITKQRTEIVKLIEQADKNHTTAEKEMTKEYRVEFTAIQKTLAQLKAASDQTEVKKQLKERGDEIKRIQTNVGDFVSKIEDAKRANDDVKHSLLAAEEARKNDLKRVADLQGELTALRKRIDENRDKATIQSDNIRNVENRLKDLLASELERKQAQTAFIEQQSVAQIDRERAWKDWQEKFDSFQEEAKGLDAELQKMEEALRGAKKAQETYVELNTKLERRINEVTEMQRLAEERLRQEWISFKADEQKRWTGYSLSSEESFRDIRKEVGKYETSINTLNEITQVMQDQLHQTTDASEKQLQELMNVVHEWMTSYQRIMGHGKKTPAAKK
jgi:chromosome segregation ATPase